MTGHRMTLAFKLARRELRGGVRGLWIVVFCLILGVAVIAAVGSLRAAIEAGLAADGRAILGGDLEVDTTPNPPPGALQDWLKTHVTQTSDVVQMRSMLVAPSGDRILVELKAVDSKWPLVGTATTDPPQPLPTAFANHGILVDRLILDRLNLKTGDSVRLGTATMRIAGVVTQEPDRVATAGILGPRVLMAMPDLPSTGLVVPGAMVRRAIRMTTQDGNGIATAIQTQFPNQGWRIRDPHDAAPSITRFIDQIAVFLTLVGLTSLLVGGIGVANGVRAWLDARTRTIATLRCLGASPNLVFAVCLIQVMALSIAGIVAGLIVGAILPLFAVNLLAALLPVPPVVGIYPQPLLLAATYGFLIAPCFALWPLGRAARIPGGALFHDGVIPETARPSWPLIAANLLLGGALVALTILSSDDRRFAIDFCAAALGTLILFRAGGWGVMRLARAAPSFRSPAVRLGITNLYRPGAPTPMMLLSAGLGLSTLAAVALIQGNMNAQIDKDLPANAPSFFFIDIQNDQVPQFNKIVAAQPGAPETHDVPSMRARIVAVKGVPVDQVRTTQDTAWALKGDRGLTYAATPPEGTRIVAGKWWPPDYDGPPLVSFDAGLAAGWHVGIGDEITVNVLGRDVTLKVASLRDIDWRTLGINFFMVTSPGLLSHAPHTHIATVKIPDQDQGGLLRAVNDALPNVTGIRVADVLGAITGVLNQVAAGLSVTGAITLLTGSLVLVGAVAAGQRQRIREAVILKTLGATRAQIRTAWIAEFGILGFVAGLIAAVVGSAASYGVMHYILHTDWIFLPVTLIYTLAGALAIMLVFGYIGTLAALRARPAPLLRNE